MMSRRLAIIAGAGELPMIVARTALEQGDAVRLILLADQDVPAEADCVRGSIASPEALIAAIRTFEATSLVLAGAVTLDDTARKGLAGALGASGAAGMGDAALSSLAGSLEKLTGAKMLGAHEVVGHLIAEAGQIAGPVPKEDLFVAARSAMKAARAIGLLDVGQAAIAQGARVIAVEDTAGTDELIARALEYRRRGLIVDSAPLVLAKASKPQQPSQIDLPAIGLQTIRNCVAAGIRFVAVEVGRTLVLNRPALAQEAEAHAVSVFGLTDD